MSDVLSGEQMRGRDRRIGLAFDTFLGDIIFGGISFTNRAAVAMAKRLQPGDTNAPGSKYLRVVEVDQAETTVEDYDHAVRVRLGTPSRWQAGENVKSVTVHFVEDGPWGKTDDATSGFNPEDSMVEGPKSPLSATGSLVVLVRALAMQRKHDVTAAEQQAAANAHST